eukprot:scpid72821/ scgid22834/ 
MQLPFIRLQEHLCIEVRVQRAGRQAGVHTVCSNLQKSDYYRYMVHGTGVDQFQNTQLALMAGGEAKAVAKLTSSPNYIPDGIHIHSFGAQIRKRHEPVNIAKPSPYREAAHTEID